ncbi:Gfo/Idh/MocA family protein [Peribacillus deserti]|uniref:Gfo/Idh/MocA family oxidoreductase n=1 Tax=Peribacillus deserti TaxID=673318 RepID=A0A2N5M6D3_9BACI|nr:Gfo/Idh/MocA family oxidoreductase [Peribacillus deserti]PLT29926.1 gfo/Idh/MocA family oxidoreductase [Peribacillus deserti]
MLKIGVIGLGDIAQKAYLPILSGISGVEFHLFTRNLDKLREIGEKYRWEELHESLDSLIQSGVKGAFVHTATESHEEIIRNLLEHGIHVFVDKPITYNYESSKALVELAQKKNVTLTVGFNRRFAPPYQFLNEIKDRNMVIMQKNRKDHPDEVRRFIFDDFIHVVDTIRHLHPYEIEQTIITGKKTVSGKLSHVTLQLLSKNGTAIGVMNRDSGTSEEKVEVFGPEEKRSAINVTDTVILRDKTESKPGGNDWEPTLRKRGFEQMIHNYIDFLKGSSQPCITPEDALVTHELCEKIVVQLERE